MKEQKIEIENFGRNKMKIFRAIIPFIQKKHLSVLVIKRSTIFEWFFRDKNRIVSRNDYSVYHYDLGVSSKDLYEKLEKISVWHQPYVHILAGNKTFVSEYLTLVTDRKNSIWDAEQKLKNKVQLYLEPLDGDVTFYSKISGLNKLIKLSCNEE